MDCGRLSADTRLCQEPDAVPVPERARRRPRAAGSPATPHNFLVGAVLRPQESTSQET